MLPLGFSRKGSAFPELCAKMIYFFQVCNFGEDKVGINFILKEKRIRLS